MIIVLRPGLDILQSVKFTHFIRADVDWSFSTRRSLGERSRMGDQRRNESKTIKRMVFRGPERHLKGSFLYFRGHFSRSKHRQTGLL